MTIFSGALAPATGLYGKASGTYTWAETVGWAPFGGHLIGAASLIGASANTQPISLRNLTGAGVVAPSLSTTFYNRILVEPLSIPLGSLVSDQSRNIQATNLYLVNVTLLAVNKTGFGTGLMLVGDATPTVYLPLQTRTYVLTATLAGPPQIDATATFDWDTGTVDHVLTVTGDRIVLFPVVYRAPATETLVWKTDVLTSRDGSEQRVRARLAPRQQLSVKGYLDRWERNRVEHLIYGWRQRIWAIPMWIEGRAASAPVTLGDTVVSVDTRWGDFRVNSMACIWESPRKYDVFQVYAKTDDSLTLPRGANADFASPVIVPVRSARLLKDPRRWASGHDAVVEALFEVTDNEEVASSASPVQFLGEDVYLDEYFGAEGDGVADEYERLIEVVDYQTGVLDMISPWSYLRVNREMEFVVEGLQAAWELRQWLHRRSGKLRPFYAPTHENNLVMVTTGNIADAFEVRKDDYTVHGKLRTHLAFLLKDGTSLLRTVVAVSDNANYTQINLDSAINVDASLIDEVSFIGLKRLSSDRVELTWHPNNVVVCRVPITEIEP